MFGLFKRKDVHGDVIDKCARVLSLQVMLCRFDQDFIDILDRDVVRGYFIGYFDCGLQGSGLSIPDDETFFLLMLRGHKALLATFFRDIQLYTVDSLRRQNKPEFQMGMRIGGAECLGVLNEGRIPFALPQYVHESQGPLAAVI